MMIHIGCVGMRISIVVCSFTRRDGRQAASMLTVSMVLRIAGASNRLRQEGSRREQDAKEGYNNEDTDDED